MHSARLRIGKKRRAAVCTNKGGHRDAFLNEKSAKKATEH